MNLLFVASDSPLGQAREALLDALFPPHCCGCKEWSKAPFCAHCLPKMRPVGAPLCQICGEPFDPLAFSAPLCAACRCQTPAFRAARSALRFEGPVREAIHRLKYGEKVALTPRLAPLLLQLLADDSVLSQFTPQLIVPVPLHRNRQRRRGYNQSVLLARELGRTLGIPVAPLLERIRDTPPQVGLSEKERLQNVRGAFALDANCFMATQARGKTTLLVDDVLTTGATLGECARILRKAGTGEICAITLAR